MTSPYASCRKFLVSKDQLKGALDLLGKSYESGMAKKNHFVPEIQEKVKNLILECAYLAQKIKMLEELQVTLDVQELRELEYKSMSLRSVLINNLHNLDPSQSILR